MVWPSPSSIKSMCRSRIVLELDQRARDDIRRRIIKNVSDSLLRNQLCHVRRGRAEYETW
jgi:hypothetical protein